MKTTADGTAATRLIITYRDTAGERQRLSFHPASTSPWWSFQEAVYREGRWCVLDAERVDAPTLVVEPWGVQSFAGP